MLPEKNFFLEKFLGEAPLDAQAIIAEYGEYARRLAPILGCASTLLNQSIAAGHNLLFEGAQGSLLDVDHGTYPYVTSSSTLAGGACTGTGVGPRFIDAVVGISKAYVTRVGEGPFPTELNDDMGEQLRAHRPGVRRHHRSPAAQRLVRRGGAARGGAHQRHDRPGDHQARRPQRAGDDPHLHRLRL